MLHLKTYLAANAWMTEDCIVTKSNVEFYWGRSVKGGETAFLHHFPDNRNQEYRWESYMKGTNLSVCSEWFFVILLSERCLSKFCGKQTLGVSQAAI